MISRDQVIQALRDFSAENPGVSVTKDYIAEKLGVDRGTITRRFGKWGELLSEVGIEPVPLGRRYTDEDCFENILTLWMHYGRQPQFGELKQFPSTVGPKAYTLRWGGWRKALSAFVKQANSAEASSIEPIEHQPIFENQERASLETPVPRSIPWALRWKILMRDKSCCVICGASHAKDVSVVLHVDHIHPWSRGGKNIEENLRILCSKCNLGKGSKLEDADLTDSNNA